jgi:SagB-type dehydrogenase family enzyme
MNNRRYTLISISLLILVLLVPACTSPVASNAAVSSPPKAVENGAAASQGTQTAVKLPDPRLKSDVSLEEALSNRRSIRSYSGAPLTLGEVSQLLWAGQGITDSKGGRTAPSAVASYPLTLYLVAGKVEGLDPGIYAYQPAGHELAKVKDGDLREALGSQNTIKTGAIDIVIAANYDKVKRFGDNGQKWVYLEGGHVAQNICLEATVLNLGTVTVGGFTEDQVKNAIGLTGNTGILYVLPVGKKSGS